MASQCRQLLTRLFAKVTIPRRFYCEKENVGPERKGIILGVYTEDDGSPSLTKSAAKLNDETSGKVMEIIAKSGFKFRKGTGKVFNNVNPEYWAVALVGLGKDNLGYNELEAIDEGMEAARQGAGIGAQLLMQELCTRISVEGMGYPEAAAVGSTLGVWKYQKNKMRKHWQVIPPIELYDDPDIETFQRGLFSAESQNLARKLSDTPANRMTPLHFAQKTVNELCPCGVKVEVHDKDWIEHQKLNAFMAVARGSCEPPVFLEISYTGGGAGNSILLVGKGITFDSGGLCLKKCKGMGEFRADMTGAAAIVGAIRTAAALSLPITVNAVIGLCENMPSGMAMKPGDVVKTASGVSVIITNTDNEGYLTMADSLYYGIEKTNPKIVIDVASLTTDIRRGLGFGAAGVYCNSQTLWSQVRKAGVITGDRVWRMPLWEYYLELLLNNPDHDLNIVGKNYGNSVKGAAFLSQFAECVDWMHFDTTGVGMLSRDKVVSYYTEGRMTGRPTRTLSQLLYQLSSAGEKK